MSFTIFLSLFFLRYLTAVLFCLVVVFNCSSLVLSLFSHLYTRSFAPFFSYTFFHHLTRVVLPQSFILALDVLFLQRCNCWLALLFLYTPSFLSGIFLFSLFFSFLFHNPTSPACSHGYRRNVLPEILICHRCWARPFLLPSQRRRNVRERKQSRAKRRLARSVQQCSKSFVFLSVPQRPGKITLNSLTRTLKRIFANSSRSGSELCCTPS